MTTSSKRWTVPVAAVFAMAATYVYEVGMLEPQVDVNLHRQGTKPPTTSVMSP